MQMKKLDTDATIRTVAHCLERPEDYLIAVLRNMLMCQKEKHRSPFARIGITGIDRVPYHKVSWIQDGRPIDSSRIGSTQGRRMMTIKPRPVVPLVEKTTGRFLMR